MWAFDADNAINPSTLNGHKCFLTSIEYFTKHMEAMTLRTIERSAVSSIHKNLLHYFSVLHDIVSDNGFHFKNEKMRSFYTKFSITHHFFAPYSRKVIGKHMPQIKS